MKIIFVIIIFLLSISSSSVFGIKYHYEWENVDVEIPLNDSNTKYIYEPKAKLFINDTYINDAEIEYNVNGDWLYYLKDVDTSKIGKYKVWYKVTESKYRPGDCPGYKQLITFNVVDKTDPQIKLHTKKMNIKLGSSIEDLNKLNFFTVSDNYDDVSNLTIHYKILDNLGNETNLTSFNSLEEYKLKIIVFDSSLNKSEEMIDINVVTSVGPKVEYNGSIPIVLKKGESIPFYELFSFNSNIDINKIRFKTNINVNELGTDTGDFIFLDEYNNETIITLPYEVKEEILPTITLNKENLFLEYRTDLSLVNFLDFVESISYKNKELSLDDMDKTFKLTIDKSNLANVVGDYNITYNLEIDRKKVSKTLVCSMRSLEAPIVSVSDVVINVGEKVELKDYIEVNDESDPNIRNGISIEDEEFDYNKEGVYYLNYKVKNSSNLFTVGVLKVIVKKPFQFFTVKNILILVLIFIASIFALIYYLYKKKHKTDEFLNI